MKPGKTHKITIPLLFTIIFTISGDCTDTVQQSVVLNDFNATDSPSLIFTDQEFAFELQLIHGTSYFEDANIKSVSLP